MRSIMELPQGECFPDTAAKVFGAMAAILPDLLTT
jgi:hypothetical protein